MIPSLFNSAIFACASLILATSSAKAEPQGFFEGHLKIITPKEVELADVTQSKTNENYADYPLIVLSQSDRKEIALVTADEHGNYRAPLPPGNYVLDIQPYASTRPRDAATVHNSDESDRACGYGH